MRILISHTILTAAWGLREKSESLFYQARIFPMWVQHVTLRPLLSPNIGPYFVGSIFNFKILTEKNSIYSKHIC